MKNVKQFAITGLRDIAREYAKERDPHYPMMKRGYEYIRDHPEEFSLVDLGNGETRLMAKGDTLVLFDPTGEKPGRRFEP